MKSRFFNRSRPMIAVLVSLCVGSAAALAAPPTTTLSETLQKAIYAEETAGNLDEAIKLYEQVIAEGKAVRNIAAQAQYRLGLVLLKQDKKSEATAAFEKVIKDYPEEEDLVAKARKHTPSAVTVGPVPWKEHEVLQLNMTLPTGVGMGTCLYRIDADTLDGKEIWRCTTRQFIALGLGSQQSFSTVSAEKESFAPLRSLWHLDALAADVEAIYGPKAVELKDLKKNTTREIPLKEPVFDNEEAAQLFRRLPLAAGYKTTVPIFASLTGTTISLELEVLGTETVEVPAGKFECFKIYLPLVGQTFFYSTDEHRYLVKFEAAGIAAELTHIYLPEPEKSTTLESKEFSLALPPDWFAYTKASSKLNDWPSTYLLNTHDVITTSISGGDRAARKEASSLESWFEADVARGKSEIKNFAVRERSQARIKVGGQPAESYLVDFSDEGKKMSQYVVNVLGEKWAVTIKFRSEPDKLDAYRAALDKVIAGLEWKP